MYIDMTTPLEKAIAYRISWISHEEKLLVSARSNYLFSREETQESCRAQLSDARAQLKILRTLPEDLTTDQIRKALGR